LGCLLIYGPNHRSKTAIRKEEIEGGRTMEGVIDAHVDLQEIEAAGYI